jgi:hypothetical protein
VAIAGAVAVIGRVAIDASAPAAACDPGAPLPATVSSAVTVSIAHSRAFLKVLQGSGLAAPG